MGNNCLHMTDSQKYRSMSRFSKNSWASEGYFNEISLDIPTEIYFSIQNSYNRHWKTMPKSEKAIKHQIQK
jgi:hypothetical protein